MSEAPIAEANETDRPQSWPDTAPLDEADSPAGKLVPVNEAIRYRKRAQAAEQKLDDLQHQLAELREQIDESRETITSLERRQRIDALLAGSEVIDLEAARLLTEMAVADLDEPDLESAVDDLRRHKPYLFRRRLEPAGAAMSAHLAEPGKSAEAAAERAISTGNRRDLLQYLRLRRSR